MLGWTCIIIIDKKKLWLASSGGKALIRFEKTRHNSSLKNIQFELTELNTPASFFCILTRARFTAGGAAATHEFPLSTERGGVTE